MKYWYCTPILKLMSNLIIKNRKGEKMKMGFCSVFKVELIWVFTWLPWCVCTWEDESRHTVVNGVVSAGLLLSPCSFLTQSIRQTLMWRAIWIWMKWSKNCERMSSSMYYPNGESVWICYAWGGTYFLRLLSSLLCDCFSSGVTVCMLSVMWTKEPKIWFDLPFLLVSL